MAEVLESECSVEMDKLLSLCRHGIPDRLRGEAWKYLLGVMRPEKSQELSLGKLMEQRYQQLERAGQADAQSELTRQIKAEVRGYLSGELFFRESRTHQRLERLLRTYLYRHTSGYIPGMVHLLGPFVQVYRDSDTDAHYGARAFGSRRPLPHTIKNTEPQPVAPPYPTTPGQLPPSWSHPNLGSHTHNSTGSHGLGAGTRFALHAPLFQTSPRSLSITDPTSAHPVQGFDELMSRLEWGLTFEGRKQMMVFFMTLLRHTLPDLYFHLEAEQRISDPAGSAWLESWLALLLSKELPLPCVLQLWDAYFSAAPEGSLHELHTFVCLSVLETCQVQTRGPHGVGNREMRARTHGWERAGRSHGWGGGVGGGWRRSQRGGGCSGLDVRRRAWERCVAWEREAAATAIGGGVARPHALHGVAHTQCSTETSRRDGASLHPLVFGAECRLASFE